MSGRSGVRVVWTGVCPWAAAGRATGTGGLAAPAAVGAGSGAGLTLGTAGGWGLLAVGGVVGGVEGVVACRVLAALARLDSLCCAELGGVCTHHGGS